MQANQFYQGVLYELHKLGGQQAPDGLKNPVKMDGLQPTPISKNTPGVTSGQATVVPASQASGQSLTSDLPAMQDTNTVPATENLYGNKGQYIVDPAAYKDQYARDLTNSISKYQAGPAFKDLAHWASTNNVGDTMNQYNELPGMSNQIIGAVAAKKMFGSVSPDIEKPINDNHFASFAYNNPELAQQANTNTLPTLMRAAQLQAGSDPGVSEDLDTATSHLSNQGGQDEVKGWAGSLGNQWDKLKHVFTGKTNAPVAQTPTIDPAVKAQTDEAKRMVMSNPRYQAEATSGALSEAGNQIGSFLMNNWGKIAMGVGGVAAFVAILKSLVGDSQQQAQPQQPYQSGPRFL